MKKVTRRYRKLIALSLFAFQLGGARVHAVTNSCDQTRTYFDAGITVKVLVKKIAGQEFGRHKGSLAFGESRDRKTASELKVVRRSHRTAPITVIAATSVAVKSSARRPTPELLAKLPSDLSPTQPTHLHSKN